MNKPEYPATVPTLKPREEEIDLGIYWTAFVEKKGFIIVVTFIVFSIALLYVVVTPPIYLANVMLQVEATDKLAGNVDDISQLLLADNTEALAELEIIYSRRVIGEVVEKLNLDIMAEPSYFPIIGAAFAYFYEEYTEKAKDEIREPLWELSQYAWGGERIEIAHLEVAKNYENKELILVATENNHYQLYDEEYNLLLKGVLGQQAVAKGNTHSLVEIVVTELHARPGTEFTLIKQTPLLAIITLQEQLEVIEKSPQTGILQIILEDSEPAEITQILNTIGQVYLQQNVERKRQETAEMLSFVNQQLPILKTNLEATEARLSVHHEKYGSIDIELETQTLLSRLVELEKQITSLELLQVDYKLKYTRNHPSLDALKTKIRQLKIETNKLNRRIDQLPEAQLSAAHAMRDVQTASEIYSFMLNQAQELNIAKAGIIGNVYIVDQADVPVEPEDWLLELIILVVALVFGSFLGMFLVLLHRTINSPEMIERRLNLPIYAIVPHSEVEHKLKKLYKKKKAASMFQVLAIHSPHDAAVEGLRSLRTSLQFALTDTNRPIIIVCGPTANVGKSFITINLGYILASVGKQVLLIDGDMRKGHLHQTLKQKLSPGLSDVISGECELETAIHDLSSPIEGKEFNISFLSAGTRPPNPSELLMHQRFQNLLDTVSKQYDMIIIDTPPVIGITDATVIGGLAGGTNLLVVRSGQQVIEEVELSVKLFEQSASKIQGIIFNDMSLQSGYGYRYHYKYSYHYK